MVFGLVPFLTVGNLSLSILSADLLFGEELVALADGPRRPLLALEPRRAGQARRPVQPHRALPQGVNRRSGKGVKRRTN